MICNKIGDVSIRANTLISVFGSVAVIITLYPIPFLELEAILITLSKDGHQGSFAVYKFATNLVLQLKVGNFMLICSKRTQYNWPLFSVVHFNCMQSRQC